MLPKVRRLINNSKLTQSTDRLSSSTSSSSNNRKNRKEEKHFD